MQRYAAVCFNIHQSASVIDLLQIALKLSEYGMCLLWSDLLHIIHFMKT